MARDTAFTTEGLEEAIEAMDEIHPRITKFVLGKATQRAAALLVRKMRSLAPVATGGLRKSIRQKNLRQRNIHSPITRLVGPSWPDGAAVNFLEYGTGASRAPDSPSPSGSKRAGIRPRRFVLRTFLSAGNRARDLAVEDAVKLADEELEALGQEKIPPAVARRAGFD